MTYQKSSPESIEKAKSAYMEGKSFSEVSEISGVPISSVKYYVASGWKKERNRLRSELLANLTEDKAADLVEITSYGLTFLKMSLKKLVEQHNVNPNPGLLKTISTIVFEINKIKALDEGRPTEILSEIKPATIVEMRELLKADPFFEIEDAEIKETNETN